MKQRNFVSRVVVPVLIVFAIMAGAFVVYNLAWHIKNDYLHHFIANFSAVILFLCVGFSPFMVYPIAFFRGATLKERILATLANPFFWAAKEVIRLTATFTLAESFYFCFNPLIISLFAGTIADMGLLELLCRRALKKRGRDIKVFSVPAFVACIAGYLFVILNLAWGQGVHSYYVFIEGYKSIFGHGL